MRKNNIKRIWAEGGVVLNCFLSIADAYSAELMAHQGFDCLTVDLQHGLQDMGDAALQFQAISTTDNFRRILANRCFLCFRNLTPVLISSIFL